MAAGAVVLYDQTGTPVPLPGPEAPPRVRFVPGGVAQDRNDRFRGYPSRNLTPAKIVQILEQADGGDPLQWIELAEEIVEKDAKIGSVIHTRTSAVLGLDWEVAPPKLDDATQNDAVLADEIAKFCAGALTECNFDELVGDLLDAIAKPFAVDWIDWGEDQQGKIVPQRFRRIPPKHIHWAFDTDTILVFDPSKPGTGPNGNMGQPLEPYTSVRALSNFRRDHPTRAGLLRTLAWYYLFKIIAIKDMVSYADRYGMPLRILKVDDVDFNNQERFDQFRSQLANLGTDASGVFTKNAELIIEKAAEQDGVSVFQTIIDYVDKSVAWTVLGHELSSQSSPGTGQLGITASLQVRQDILEGDCEFISQIIKRDVLTPLVGWNFGWDRMALTPYIYFDYEPPRDLQVEANVLATVAKTFPKLEFSEQQVREQFGFEEPLDAGTDPEADDVLIPGTPTPQSGPLQPDPNAPDLTINSLSARPPARFAKSHQRKIDRLGDKTLEAAASVLDKWKRQLAEMVQIAAENGESLLDLRRRIVTKWPELDVRDLERLLREGKVLARMFGRNV